MTGHIARNIAASPGQQAQRLSARRDLREPALGVRIAEFGSAFIPFPGLGQIGRRADTADLAT